MIGVGLFVLWDALPLVEAIQELREAGHVELPVSLPAPTEPASMDSPLSAPSFSIPAPI